MPTATSTFGEIMTTVVNTSVDLTQEIFTNYWPYILVIGAISALVIWFKRLVFTGAR